MNLLNRIRQWRMSPLRPHRLKTVYTLGIVIMGARIVQTGVEFSAWHHNSNRRHIRRLFSYYIYISMPDDLSGLILLLFD
jgi:hypothetical protein